MELDPTQPRPIPRIDDPLLMIPGPSDVEDRVLAEMGRQVVAHYGAAWAEFFNETVDRLRRVLRTEGDVFIYAGSGRLGLDAAIGSLFEPGSAVLVVRNGHFGERLEALSLSHDLYVIPCDAPWGAVVRGDAVAAVLDQHPEAVGVLVVHGETSTDVLNPVEEIAGVAKERGRLVVVDAVSSAGAAPLEAGAWGIDVLVTASQKGLGAPPGLVIVGVSRAAWAAIDARRDRIRGWSTNLAKWREYLRFRDYQPYYITMPVNVVRALRASLDAIEAEGLAGRIERHRAVSSLLRKRLSELGLTVEADPEFALPTVTVFRCPAGVPAARLRDWLAAETGISVATGLGAWQEDRIRVGHMGRNASPEVIERFASAVARGVAALAP